MCGRARRRGRRRGTRREGRGERRCGGSAADDGRLVGEVTGTCCAAERPWGRVGFLNDGVPFCFVWGRRRRGGTGGGGGIKYARVAQGNGKLGDGEELNCESWVRLPWRFGYSRFA